MMKVQRTM